MTRPSSGALLVPAPAPYDASMRSLRDPRFWRPAWAVLAVVGWSGLLWIGTLLASQEPSRAGDDLRLLVDAARRLVDGAPLYSTSGVGEPILAEGLFYSYPPPVAQALVPVSGLPFGLVLLLWGVGATAGLALVARLAGHPAGGLVLPTLALAPYTMPFVVALLFGNLDAWLPLAYGLVLAGVLKRTRGTALAGGVALGAVAVAKLHPATLILWLVARAAERRRRAPEGVIAAIALAVGATIVLVSLLVGGTDPWSDYVAFLRSAAATTDLVSRLNVGPASQAALLLGLDAAAARSIQMAILLGALAISLVAGWKVRDPVVSFGLATTASLVVLPVTWVHYPAALIPVAIAAAARATATDRPLVGGLLVAALVVAAVAVVVPVLVWIAVGLVLAAAGASRPVAPEPAGDPARSAGVPAQPGAPA